MEAQTPTGNRRDIGSVGLVLHPRRDSAEAVGTITAWAARRDVTVFGLATEIDRLGSSAVPVDSEVMASQADLLVGLGGDGTVLRAMRLSDHHGALVLGVNLGKLGFLAEVDIPDLAAALRAIGDNRYEVEPRTALDTTVEGCRLTAFNDIVLVRVPGDGMAAVGLAVEGHHFVDYAADAVIVATPTGSTAYNFSAGGPIVAPSIAGILVTPSSPHSVYNRAIMVESTHSLALTVLPSSGRLAVEVDGVVATYAEPGDTLTLTARSGAAQVIRLGRSTFYQRAQRKLRITGSAELNSSGSGSGSGSAGAPS
jgi:NAD+ kinase